MMNGHEFFMTPAGSRHAYCSKCGSKVLQDRYNLIKHGKLCGFSQEAPPEILTAESFRYTLEKEDSQTLVIKAGHPVLKLRPGFRDNYEGGTWESDYEARFRWNSRTIDETFRGDPKPWIYLITSGKIPYMGKETQEEVISSVFAVVPAIYDLTMFFQIYSSKGYQVTPYRPSSTLLNEVAQFRPGELVAHAAKQKNKLVKQAAVYGNTVVNQGHTLLALRLYLPQEKMKTWKMIPFLLGEGILWTPRKDLLKTIVSFILNLPLTKTYLSEETVADFDQHCPSFGFGNYLKGGGTNPLLPFFLSGNYHKGMELLIKSGMSPYADHYFTFRNYPFPSFFPEHQEPAPWTYRNVPELLGIPLALLKTIPPAVLRDSEDRARLSHCYRANRPLLEGIKVNQSVLRFLRDQDVTHDNTVRRNRIAGLTALSDADIRKILKYLSSLEDHQYTYYQDYLHMMHVTNIYTFGLCPENLQEAHDDLLRTLVIKKEKDEELQFRQAVDRYRSMETRSADEEEDEILREAPYLIRCPQDSDDLTNEGRMQHNCVASYHSAVLQHRSQIFFMRSKKAPDDSLVTIEVRYDRLIQAKAAFNQPAPEDCQRFVCRWCKTRGISYANCLDITLAKTG